MSKATVTRLFIWAILALAVGVVVALATIVAAIAGGAVTIGGPSIIAIDGELFAESIPWLLIAAILVLGGSVAAVASWIGALFNTWQLDDKTWFVVLLLLGLCSFGWVAMTAYVIAGPDTSAYGVTRRGIAANPSA